MLRGCVRRLLRPNYVDELPQPAQHFRRQAMYVFIKLERRVGFPGQLKLNNAEWLPRPSHTASHTKLRSNVIDHLSLLEAGGIARYERRLVSNGMEKEM